MVYLQDFEYELVVSNIDISALMAEGSFKISLYHVPDLDLLCLTGNFLQA